ncbi:fasciclin-like arabinogalactan protein 3 [Cicer arietinum]|uniref:Fasciclin-like arabinogalactan protein 14 n=1 Tax=Cicer arietinum TaxID=3827 RepID=A0A1S2Y8U3_CICAR|nr:fasciclin-like arabinogalactan protein 14 [Cicer arietinum]
MGLRNPSILWLALMLSFSSAINCLDITKTLEQYPEFSTFNKYLTETKLVEQINGAKAVTVLAIDNKDIASLSGKSLDAVKTVIGTHVVTEFYDEKKLVEAVGSHAELATLSTASGLASKIYVGLINEGEVAFSSAVQGATFDAKLVRTVTTQPDTVSVLQVTQPIVKVAESSTPVTPNGVEKEVPTSSIVAESPKSIGAEAPAPSSSSRTTFGFVGAVLAFASVFVSL